jgi:hypothetical protein
MSVREDLALETANGASDAIEEHCERPAKPAAAATKRASIVILEGTFDER